MPGLINYKFFSFYLNFFATPVSTPLSQGRQTRRQSHPSGRSARSPQSPVAQGPDEDGRLQHRLRRRQLPVCPQGHHQQVGAAWRAKLRQQRGAPPPEPQSSRTPKRPEKITKSENCLKTVLQVKYQVCCQMLNQIRGAKLENDGHLFKAQK